MNVTVIAEPGATHEGDHDTILRLIEAAAEAGADVFKNQYCSDPERLIQRRTARLEPAEAEAFRTKYLPFYSWLAYPLEWHAEFRAYCHERGLKYGCSTVLPEDVAELKPFVDLFKIPSFEALSRDLLDAHEDAGGHLIISTGMLDEDQVRWLDAWRRRGRNVGRTVSLLHCVTSYPCPAQELNLRTLEYPWCDGLSDHSRHTGVGGVAVKRGAKVIEAHLRLDDCSPDNPDYATAFTPSGFALYVQNIRSAEAGEFYASDEDVMLGDGVKRPMEAEAEMAQYRVTQ